MSDVAYFVLQFFLALFIANGIEWAFHKFVLHELGKRGIWSSHWKEHHRNSRRNNFYDEEYNVPVTHIGAYGKEAYALLVGFLIGVILLFFVPGLGLGFMTSVVAYFFVHRKSHIDTEWARKWVPWHVDHHMGKNQDANFCVVFPLWDYILGTRIKYEYDEEGKCVKIRD